MLGATVMKFAMSASRAQGTARRSAARAVPLRSPGSWRLVQPKSCVPSPVVKGVPIFSPWPGMVAQFTPSIRPAVAQLVGLMPWLTTPEPGKPRYVVGDAAGGREGVKSRSIVPSVADGGHGVGRANRLIVEEGEDFILPDGAADAAAELIEKIVVSRRLTAWAVEPLIGIQVGTVSGEKKTAMELVGAALGSHLNLGATEAAILGVVAVGDDLHVFNGIFRRGDDCSSAPDGAGGADAVNRNAVVLDLPAMG